jgi:acetolactate synthase-1/2/3 large subunit
MGAAAPVVAISGDGRFNMILGELETTRRAECGLTVSVVNNVASGYVNALQHAMMGGRYQSADLNEVDYAAIARTMGCGGSRGEDAEALSPALRQGLEERDRATVIDVVVARDPAQMFAAVGNRTVEM